MRYTLLVGLNVINPEIYASYRQAMMPILIEYGGRFTYDFLIAKTLQSPASQTINRLFTLDFPNRQQKVDFFDDQRYQQIKQTYFNPSVANSTIVAEYTNEAI